jgi:hypothetical protein
MAPTTTTARPSAPTQETWRNFTRGTIGVRRLDHRGELTGYELVRAGYRLHILPEERRLNQEKVADPTQDPFTNGMFVPERLDDSDPDTAALLANPNIVSDDEMPKLVRGAAKAMVDRIAQITNLLTLERILQAAMADPDVKLRRVEAIKARIAEVRTDVTQRRRAEIEAARERQEEDPRARRRLRQPGAGT